MNTIDCGHGVKYHVGNGESKTHHMVLLLTILSNFFIWFCNSLHSMSLLL